MNAFILRPLNVPQAQSLYALQHGNEASGSESYPNYLDLRDRNHSFDGLVAYNISGAGLDTGGKSIQRMDRGSQRELLRRIGPSTVSRPFLSRLPMSMAPTALRISCSPTRAGIPIFKTIAPWWAGSCGSMGIPSPSSASPRPISTERFCFSISIFCAPREGPVAERGRPERARKPIGSLRRWAISSRASLRRRRSPI